MNNTFKILKKFLNSLNSQKPFLKLIKIHKKNFKFFLSVIFYGISSSHQQHFRYISFKNLPKALFLGSDIVKLPTSPPKEDLMTRLKSEVYKRRIRVKEFFYDFDRLRKGTINEDKFRSALSMLNIFMTELDIKDLITRYKDSEG